MPQPRTWPAITAYSLVHLPERLKKKRLQLGLSQRQAAEQSGVARTTMHRLEETGDAYPAALIKAFMWLDGNVQGPGEQPGPQSTAQAAELGSTPARRGPSTGPPVAQG